MTIDQEISACKSAIRSCQLRIDRLIAEHGDGVRPAWVSGDIGHEQGQIAAWERTILKLQGEKQ